MLTSGFRGRHFSIYQTRSLLRSLKELSEPKIGQLLFQLFGGNRHFLCLRG